MSVPTVKIVKEEGGPCFFGKVVCIHFRIAALLHDVGTYCSGGFYAVLPRRLSKCSGLEEMVTPLYGGICAIQVNVVWVTMDD
jgi:hypothetical protein